MAERDQNPTREASSNLEQVNIPSSPACGQWETLLVDAMDGALRPEDEEVFSSHLASCASCAEMFEQVRRGREWLEFLAPEPQVPVHLLDRILAETGRGKVDPARFAPAPMAVAGVAGVLTMPPVWQQVGFGRNGFRAAMRRFAEPRLLMTAAMAFFSIALTLSMTGVRFSGFRMADLRPSSIRSVVEKRIMTASTPLIRYYDHLRFVYEVESTVKEMRRNSESQPKNENQGQPGNGESNRKDGGKDGQKDGGSQVRHEVDPDRAPLQTVNPPASLQNGDVLEVRFHASKSRGTGPSGLSESVSRAKQFGSRLFKTQSLAIGRSRSVAVQSLRASLTVSERSQSCPA